VTASHAVVLVDCHAGATVDATLFPRINATYAERAEVTWAQFLDEARAEALRSGEVVEAPSHAHWQWHKKVKETERLLSFPTMAVECGGTPQGLMLIRTDGQFCRLGNNSSRPLVYINLLATAPWNLPKVVSAPRFRGVGTILVRAAVETSIDLGFEGRIGLHSLPDAENFYERHRLTCLGPDPEHENLKYFELTAAAAVAFTR
jgi:hypothetical protein